MIAANNKQLLDHLTTAVIFLNSELEIIEINVAAESLLAISATKAIGTPLKKFFHESTEAQTTMQYALQHDNQYTKRKAQWCLHNKKMITVDYTVTPLVDREQLLLEIQPLDRLLRISREESVITSQETTRNLIRGLAHEVKNPLGGIRGAAQLLDKELNNEELKEYTHIIVEESDRLRNLVDRMLGPRQLPTFQETNIHEVLGRVHSIINAEMHGKIPLRCNYDPSIPEILGDKEMLIQALLNIVRNAVQALVSQKDNQQPEIVITTRINRQFTIGRSHHPLAAKISITDNGPGIPANIIEDIFYPMISGRAQGTGLGLSISQQLITQHKGLIECSSEPGQTVFSIYIPLDIK